MAANADDEVSVLSHADAKGRKERQPRESVGGQHLTLAVPAPDEIGAAGPAGKQGRAITVGVLQIFLPAPFDIIQRSLNGLGAASQQFREVGVVLRQDHDVAAHGNANAVVVAVGTAHGPGHVDHAGAACGDSSPLRLTLCRSTP